MAPNVPEAMTMIRVAVVLFVFVVVVVAVVGFRSFAVIHHPFRGHECEATAGN